MKLSPDPGRVPLPRLLFRFARAEVQSRVRRVRLRTGLISLLDAVPEDWAIPDSALASTATEMSQRLCSASVVHHCVRSYCFGAILAARNGLKLDRETFYVAAMLHDLGLTESHADDAGSFEWVGAKLARAFCVEQGEPEERSDLVHEAIALHTSVGIADSRCPEIAMLHFGTGMDLLGMRVEEVGREDLQRILQSHPREDFPDTFGTCLQHQAQSKPRSHIAGLMGVGLKGMIRESLVPSGR